MAYQLSKTPFAIDLHRVHEPENPLPKKTKREHSHTASRHSLPMAVVSSSAVVGCLAQQAGRPFAAS